MQFGFRYIQLHIASLHSWTRPVGELRLHPDIFGIKPFAFSPANILHVHELRGLRTTYVLYWLYTQMKKTVCDSAGNIETLTQTWSTELGGTSCLPSTMVTDHTPRTLGRAKTRCAYACCIVYWGGLQYGEKKAPGNYLLVHTLATAQESNGVLWHKLAHTQITTSCV